MERENTKTSSKPSSSPSRATKRSHDDMEDSEDMDCTDTDTNTAATDDNSEDKRSRQNTFQGPRSTSSEPDLNFPLPNETGPACLLKVYDKIDHLKVNDMLEVVGILSTDPSMAADSQDSSTNNDDGEEGEEVDMESTSVEQQLPPPSLVPRLHAVVVARLEHNNPWLLPSINKDGRDKILAETGEDLKTLRRRLLELLQQVAFGDSLAAEYLLCHLISSVYFSSGLLPIGKLSLNLSKVPPSFGYARLLHQFISSLVTKCYLLPLSLSYLNGRSFNPQKDYSKNRLKSSVLQMSKQTHLVLDETQLEAGQLNVEGHKNIKTLESVIRVQKIQYDFGFYQRDYDANIEVICLSEGKSILPSDVHIPLEIHIKEENLNSHFSHLSNEMTPNLVKKFQIYLGLAKTMEYKVDKQFEEFVQNDFINMRKDNSKSITEDGLHFLLNLTRLLTMSWGLPAPTVEMWQRAKTLEASCRQRIINTTQSSH
ncbi:mini-chromosome maintenance complex-binding protein-like [Argonauta hians]